MDMICLFMLFLTDCYIPTDRARELYIYIYLYYIYIYICYPPPPPPGLSTNFGGEIRVGPNGPFGGPCAEHGHPGYLPFLGFLVEIIEVAHCPGCDASRPIRGECLVNAKVRRGLGLVPCLPKSPKAIHTLGVVVCRIINYKGTLVFERGAIYATTFLQRSKIGKVGVSLFISKVYTL